MAQSEAKAQQYLIKRDIFIAVLIKVILIMGLIFGFKYFKPEQNKTEERYPLFTTDSVKE